MEYLINNDLASEIRIVDKTPPQMAWLNHSHTLAFNHPTVEFFSANLINQGESSNLITSFHMHKILFEIYYKDLAKLVTH